MTCAVFRMRLHGADVELGGLDLAPQSIIYMSAAEQSTGMVRIDFQGLLVLLDRLLVVAHLLLNLRHRNEEVGTGPGFFLKGHQEGIHASSRIGSCGPGSDATASLSLSSPLNGFAIALPIAAGLSAAASFWPVVGAC